MLLAAIQGSHTRYHPTSVTKKSYSTFRKFLPVGSSFWQPDSSIQTTKEVVRETLMPSAVVYGDDHAKKALELQECVRL